MVGLVDSRPFRHEAGGDPIPPELVGEERGRGRLASPHDPLNKDEASVTHGRMHHMATARARLSARPPRAVHCAEQPGRARTIRPTARAVALRWPDSAMHPRFHGPGYPARRGLWPRAG